MEMLFYRVMGLFLDLFKALHTTQEVSTWIGHWIARFLVVLIFISAVVSACNAVALVVGLSLIPENHILLKIISLFSKPSAWVAATAIIATTVAMDVSRNYRPSTFFTLDY